MKKLLKFILLSACLHLGSHAAEVLIKQSFLTLTSPSGVKIRESKFYIKEEIAEKLPPFDLLNDKNYLSIAKALTVAFRDHFEKHGISSERFFREAQVSFEKADDYTASIVAKSTRSSGSAVRNLWFYIVRCDYVRLDQTAVPPVPIVVLMDGSTLLPVEQIKDVGAGK